jgi:hypothetical protein
MQAVFMPGKNALYDGLPDVPIRLLQENILPAIAPQYHVIKAATDMDAGFASHAYLNKEVESSARLFMIEREKVAGKLIN